jgi:imidazolonepropionase-like amidohydrolase
MARLALHGVIIVDPRDGGRSPGMTIVAENGRIAALERTTATTEIGGAQSIVAAGKFVTPGYLDMHAHPIQARDQAGSLAMMLAHGITGVRQMSGSPDLLAARRAGTLTDGGPGPELLEMPGMVLTPFNAPSPDAAIAEVRRQKEAGADFIKVVEVSKPTFFAALGEAVRVGLPFAGHIPATVDVAEAAKAGMKSVEHLFGSIEASSSESAALLQAPVSPPALPPLSEGADLSAMAERALANPILLRPPSYERERRVVETFSAEKCEALAAQFANAGTWQVPTLIRLRTMEVADDPRYSGDPNLRFVPAGTRKLWEGLGQQFAARIAPATREMLGRLFELQLRAVKMFQEAGVRLAAGSDFGGGWCIPGVSLHQEFALLAEAGLTPLQILQMTTLNGAKFLNREANMGTVEVGKSADLVLLDADPLAEVANFGRIHAVVRAGTYYSVEALDRLKVETEARHAT